MKLQHIGISVLDITEVENFYQKILGMKKVSNFTLNSLLSEQIFDINIDTSVFLLQKDEVYFEIFVTNFEKSKNFNHFCIEVQNREILVEKAQNNGYKCYRKKRDKPDLIFIYDKTGNVFEIKEQLLNST